MNMHYLSYLIILVLTWPIRWLPYPAIHCLGTWLGRAAFYLLKSYRKRALSNLSLATNLNLQKFDIQKLAKASFENLMITCLEYPKLASETKIKRIAHCQNPEIADRLMKEGKPVIFFCGHQANWEILFLEGTNRMPGIAIGRPVKNTYLYRFVLKMREKFGGRIIAPQNAVREGLKGLKKGSFLGIVGDQGRPDSGYCSPFFGRIAYTSPIPAILSHRTGSPIIVATTKRVEGRYIIHYSDPIWPNRDAPIEQEIDRMMRHSLSLLEDSIRQNPEQWLWVHNRWKLQSLDVIKRPFRHESIAIFFPQNRVNFLDLLSHLSTFRLIYPQESFTLFVPSCFHDLVKIKNMEVIPYNCFADLLVTDYRFKLIFNFSECCEIEAHFKKQATFMVVDIHELKRRSGSLCSNNLSDILRKAVCHAS